MLCFYGIYLDNLNRYVYTFIVHIDYSSSWSRASVWVSSVVPSRAEGVIQANPLWLGKIQRHRPCRQQLCQWISRLPHSCSDSDFNSQITSYDNGFTRYNNTTNHMCIVGSSDSIANGYNSVLAKQEKQKAEYNIDIFISFRVHIYFLFRMPDRCFYLFISIRHRLWYGRVLLHSVAKRL